MSTPTAGLYTREGGATRYLRGDVDPVDFSWNDYLTKANYLTLLLRNGKIRKACSWVSREALRPRFVMKKEKAVPATKFGKPYTFDTIIEYLEWIGFFTELECVYTWSRCLGTSIIVMYKEGEGKKAYYEPRPDYDSLKAYYPTIAGNGYDVVKKDESYFYKISITDILGTTDVFYVAKERVIPFNAPHLELKYEGNSEIEALAKIAIVQEQMLKSVMKTLHELGAGVTVIKASSEEEKRTIEASIGDSLKYLHKIFTSEDPEKVLAMFTPDIKANQFREVWDISQEEIANNMNMSKKLISGDPQGQISSAKWDTEISYTEVYQTQRHYKKATENILFLLSFPDTTFEWNDPFPTEQEDTDNDPNAPKDGQSKKEDKKPIKKEDE